MDGSRSLTAMLATAPAFAAMGEPLEHARRELLAWGHELARTVDPAHAGAVDQALRYLESLACRVAVIGQVKAGKSSFIGALVGKPNLLPSDVNPWTTVVTNLHCALRSQVHPHARRELQRQGCFTALHHLRLAELVADRLAHAPGLG